MGWYSYEGYVAEGEGNFSIVVCCEMLNYCWCFRRGSGDGVVQENDFVYDGCRLENLGVNCYKVWSLFLEGLVEGNYVCRSLEKECV